MTTVAVLFVFVSVWWGLGGPGDRGQHRGVEREIGSRSARRAGATVIADPRTRALACAGSGAVAGWALGGLALAVAGVLLGVAVSSWVGRLEAAGSAAERETMARDLPLVVDLLAACTAAGQPVDSALAIVGQAVGGPLAQRLDALLARLSLGADPVTEWGQLTADDQLGALARTLMRSSQSGAPLAGGLVRLAEDSRRVRRTSSQVRARSVGVKAAGPLAACFLPAFMLIGVVPTIAGAFSSLGL